MNTINAKYLLGPDGWQADRQVGIGADGRIASVGPAREAATHQVDILLPAPSNLHSHAFQRAMAGLTEARGPDPTDSFWTWRQLMYRFLARLTPEHIETIAAMAYVEMLEAGYAAVAEFHYLHQGPNGERYDNPAELSERVISAATQAGIGLTHLPVFYQYGGCDRRALEGSQRRFGTDPAGYGTVLEGAERAIARASADYALGLAPHSLRAVDPEGLHEILALARDRPVHIHLAEQQAEVDELIAHRGARPIEWLLDHAPVDRRWCLVHCTQTSAAETERLARSGAVVGLCPITEASLGDGIFPADAYRRASGVFGVGTDSNIEISLFGELKVLEYSQRLRDRHRAVLAEADHSTGRVLFDAALSGGARAAGRHSGALSVGHWADLLSLRGDNPTLVARRGDALLDSLIFAAPGRAPIDNVWSAGRHVVREGRHYRREAIERAYCRVVESLETGA